MFPLGDMYEDFYESIQISHVKLGQAGAVAQETIANQLGILYVHSNEVKVVHKQHCQVVVPKWKSELLWLPKTLDISNVGLFICSTTVNSKYVVDAQGKLVTTTMAEKGHATFDLHGTDMSWLETAVRLNFAHWELVDFSTNYHPDGGGRKLSLKSKMNMRLVLLTMKYPFLKSYVGTRKSKGRPSSKPPHR